jgi:Beige/BEACH domain
MLTEFHGFPIPDPGFNLCYLEPSEFLITSVNCSLNSGDFEWYRIYSSEGKLYLCTRSLIFNPDFIKSPLIKISLSNPDLICSSKFQSLHSPHSPSSRIRIPSDDKITSPLRKYDLGSLLIYVPRCIMVSRYPPSPGLSIQLTEVLEFKMSQEDLAKLFVELDMVDRSSEEKSVVQLIFTIRYTELVDLLVNTADFNPDEILLDYKSRRILPEGEQWGAFVLTQSSIHFYPLMNSKPEEPVHIDFQDIRICMRYKYQSKCTGIRVDIYSSIYPLVFILETEEQTKRIFEFMQNKIKFKNPFESLIEYMDMWTYGKITNFEYIMVLNNLANRCCVDFSQYPVFPWIISKYQNQINLLDKNAYRDLTKPIGELETSRYERLKVLFN